VIYSVVFAILLVQRSGCEDGVGNTTKENPNIFLSNPGVLVAVRKGMRAIKLCSQQNLAVFNWDRWLTQVDLCNGCKMVCVCL